jgi:ribosomal protein S18 acetylase RimI-like enzyme
MPGPDPSGDLTFRDQVLPEHRDHVRRIVESSGFFHAEEVDVAVELVDERLAKGLDSGYHFVFADRGGHTVGYACFGPIPCTRKSWDLYWIAVDGKARGGGLGRRVLEEAERRIAALGGRRVWVETSSRPQYEPTREFYRRTGYAVASIHEDFYDDDDGKVTFVKAVG